MYWLRSALHGEKIITTHDSQLILKLIQLGSLEEMQKHPNESLSLKIVAQRTKTGIPTYLINEFKLSKPSFVSRLAHRMIHLSYKHKFYLNVLNVTVCLYMWGDSLS